MRKTIEKIALGGGCHWCTEAVFQSLVGVNKVSQGFVASVGDDSAFSEAIIIYFDKAQISLKDLIEVHLYTHQSTSDHKMRTKYRSAIYVFSEKQKIKAKKIINDLQKIFGNRIITIIFDFHYFKPSEEQFINYFYENPQKPFCKTYINPKLQLLRERFSEKLNSNRLNSLKI